MFNNNKNNNTDKDAMSSRSGLGDDDLVNALLWGGDGEEEQYLQRIIAEQNQQSNDGTAATQKVQPIPQNQKQKSKQTSRHPTPTPTTKSPIAWSYPLEGMFPRHTNRNNNENDDDTNDNDQFSTDAMTTATDDLIATNTGAAAAKSKTINHIQAWDISSSTTQDGGDNGTYVPDQALQAMDDLSTVHKNDQDEGRRGRGGRTIATTSTGGGTRTTSGATPSKPKLHRGILESIIMAVTRGGGGGGGHDENGKTPSSTTVIPSYTNCCGDIEVEDRDNVTIDRIIQAAEQEEDELLDDILVDHGIVINQATGQQQGTVPWSQPKRVRNLSRALHGTNYTNQQSRGDVPGVSDQEGVDQVSLAGQTLVDRIVLQMEEGDVPTDLDDDKEGNATVRSWTDFNPIASSVASASRYQSRQQQQLQGSHNDDDEDDGDNDSSTFGERNTMVSSLSDGDTYLKRHIIFDKNQDTATPWWVDALAPPNVGEHKGLNEENGAVTPTGPMLVLKSRPPATPSTQNSTNVQGSDGVDKSSGIFGSSMRVKRMSGRVASQKDLWKTNRRHPTGPCGFIRRKARSSRSFRWLLATAVLLLVGFVVLAVVAFVTSQNNNEESVPPDEVSTLQEKTKSEIQ
jgi:hypothetical protein